LGIALAKHWNTLVLSADSRQFYKETAIGTAKPSLEEQDGVKHYFVDSHSIHEPLSSAQYEKKALAILEAEFKKHEIILLVGGSGMFVDALCYGLDDIPHDADVKNELNKEFQQLGLASLLLELKVKDPVYYESTDLKNPVRIIRALEVIRISGKTYSSYQKFQPQVRDFKIHKFVIDLPRDYLYQRINKRVDLMVDAGLLEEVQRLFPWQDLQTLNTVGYSELFSYLRNEIDMERALELIQQNTRRYAKRQLTWFRRDPNNHWISETDLDSQFQYVLNHEK
jgi:tRNA dimethylallyltransferase